MIPKTLSKHNEAKEKHTKSNEAKLRRHLEREMRRSDKKMDELFMEDLEQIYKGEFNVFNSLPEGGSYRCSWRGPYMGVIQSVVPNHEADLVVTKKHGKPVITILDTPVPNEETVVKMTREKIESGEDVTFNGLRNGEQYEDLWIGPGKDLWHPHEMVIAKKNGKAQITIAERPTNYGTEWG